MESSSADQARVSRPTSSRGTFLKQAGALGLAVGAAGTLGSPLAAEAVSSARHEARNPYAEHMNISVAFISAADDIKPNTPDAVLKYIEQKFNITITPVEETWSNMYTQPPLWAASGQLPDIFLTDAINTPNYFQWISQGLIRALPRDLSAYPHVKKMVDLPDFQGYKYQGQAWVFPRLVMPSTVSPADRGVIVRKDWMSKLGLKDPQTWDQFVALLTAFVRNNPDHNKNVTGITTNDVGTFRTSVFNSWNPYPEWWVKYRGKWVAPIEYPAMLTTINMAHQLYTHGLLDKDWGNPNNNPTTKFIAGQAGAIEWQPKHLDQLAQAWDQSHRGAKFTDIAKILLMPPGPDGKRYIFEYRDWWSESTFSAAVSDAKMARILALYDYLLSPAGRKLVLFGFAGKDYKMVGDTVVSLHPASWNIGAAYPSTGVFNSLAAWGLAPDWQSEFKVANPIPATWTPALWSMFQQYVRLVLRTCSRYPIDWAVTAYASSLPHAMDPSDTAFVQAVAASNPTQVWAGYVQEENKLGLAKATAMVNKKFK